MLKRHAYRKALEDGDVTYYGEGVWYSVIKHYRRAEQLHDMLHRNDPDYHSYRMRWTRELVRFHIMVMRDLLTFVEHFDAVNYNNWLHAMCPYWLYSHNPKMKEYICSVCRKYMECQLGCPCYAHGCRDAVEKLRFKLAKERTC